jgi:hypothetical protein
VGRSGGGGEFEHHVVAVRMRVTGTGSLNFGLESLNAIKTQTLVPITMAAQTNIEPTRLANFQSQRVRWTLSNDVSDCSGFTISRIILFAKPVAAEYPM